MTAKATPFKHDRRRKVPAGYTVDSEGYLLSPRRQLLFVRKQGRKTVWVEGDMLGVYDALQGLVQVARKARRALRAKRI